MKKTVKPVPNVDCLKYKGTPEKPDIKIFVSHRIDLDSVTIDNPLYIPVRCGATFDERTEEEIGGMLGDDTGDNISEKRFTYNELTVMYWAWKNINADYYGLCHYRRYLSFSKNQHYIKNQFQLVESDVITEQQIEKFGLTKQDIQRIIYTQKPDVVLPEIFNICQINNNAQYTHRKRYEDDLGKKFSESSINKLLDVIEELYPDYLEDAKEYYDGHEAYFCNCFVMKKDIFNEYCQWLFDILFSLEDKIDYSLLSMKKSRILGFFSEDLFSIYVMKKIKEKHWKKVELEMVWFRDTAAKHQIKPVFPRNSINILLSADNIYSIYMGVLIQSIIDNSSEKNNYDIIIFHTDISEENRKIISSLVDGRKNFSIRFTDISVEIGERQFGIWAHYKKYNVYRLVAPDVLASYDKIVYLDSDIVVERDVAELYNTDVSNYLIAAVPEIRVYSWLDDENNILHEYFSKTLKLPKDHLYFNSGVLVYNLKKFRESCSGSYMLDVCAQRFWQYIDQDVLNIVCAGQTLYLPMNWNVEITADNFQTEIRAPLSMYQDYCAAHKKPYAVHFAGDFLPFKAPTVEFYWLFWKYARHTPYYEILLDRMINLKVQAQILPPPAAAPLPDTRSPAKKALDQKYPLGSKKRMRLERFCPYGTRRWRMAKKMWYFFHPSQKPQQ